VQRYNPKDIEPKWQAKWAADKTYAVDLHDDSKPKFYGFAMLPYPSGTGLHTGHVRTYTLADVTVRAKRQQGYNAYNPIGWDAFGLPAENYAIKTGQSPQETIRIATDRFREQLTRIGMSHDWSKEINTSDPRYYKWTQWVFTKLFEQGLAYQKESAQWWCPVDKTVLANEQVEAGKCWRCGNIVEKKFLKQWFFKITDYADELLESGQDLDWPGFIKMMQRNWIGRSEGAEITFQIVGHSNDLTVFTTRPDTIYGATFMVVAPEHPLIQTITADGQKDEVQAYIKQAQAKSDIERQDTNRQKTGVFTGAYAVNPVTGDNIPIWIADYVLYTYGTGAIMAVPAHDERDYEFAAQFNLPVTWVVNPEIIREDAKDKVEFKRHEKIVAVVENNEGNILTINWGPQFGGRLLIGGTVEDNETPETTALREVTEETGYSDLEVIEAGTETFYYKYYAFSKREAHDVTVKFVHIRLKSDARQDQNLDTSEQDKFSVEWVSRVVAEREIVEPLHRYGIEKFVMKKRFHGEGIMVNSGEYDGLPSSEAREKIVADLEAKGIGKAVVNYKIRDWLISRQRYWGAPIPIVYCEKDGAVAVPQDQLPVILPEVKNYQPDGTHTSVLAGVTDWVNTTCPTCGGPATRETDTMDGYACSSWYFLRYLDPHNDQQAWDPAVTNQWMPVDQYNGADHAVSHLLYTRFWTHFFHKLGLVDDPEPVKRLVYNAYILAPDGTKMSKSKGNVVDPLEIIDSGYGADALRVYEMFIAPYDLEAPWDTRGVPGCYRFIQRTWNLVQEYLASPKVDETNEADAAPRSAQASEVLRLAHKTTKKVTEDLAVTKFNTAIAAMMEAVNGYMKLKTTGLSQSAEWTYAIESLVQLVAPFAPHVAEELWEQLGHSDTVHRDHWPKYDEKYLVSDTATLVVQVNGKLRAQLQIDRDADESQAVEAAKSDKNVRTHLDGGTLLKTIYVPGKLVNFVVR
jgi:leucyl-tRNA synthetase